MVLQPIAGKSGFLLDASGIEYPIYSWGFSSIRERSKYNTSITQNFSKRVKLLRNEMIIIRGVGISSPFSSIFFSSDLAVEFTIGWYNLNAGLKYVIPLTGSLLEERIDINYFAGNQPTHIWTAILMAVDGVIDTVSLTPQAIGIINDKILCNSPKCSQLIRTSDTTLNAGLVKHVRRASIISLRERGEYYTLSNSNNRFVHRSAGKDQLVEMELEGDFDYWVGNLTTDARHNYRFHYGSAGGEYWSANNMVQNDITNLIVNIQTGELIRATVHLGASYG